MLVAIVVAVALAAAMPTVVGALVRIVTVTATVAIGHFGAARSIAIVRLLGMDCGHEPTGQRTQYGQWGHDAQSFSHCSTLPVSTRASHAHGIQRWGDVNYMWETFPCQVDVA